MHGIGIYADLHGEFFEPDQGHWGKIIIRSSLELCRRIALLVQFKALAENEAAP